MLTKELERGTARQSVVLTELMISCHFLLHWIEKKCLNDSITLILIMYLSHTCGDTHKKYISDSEILCSAVG